MNNHDDDLDLDDELTALIGGVRPSDVIGADFHIARPPASNFQAAVRFCHTTPPEDRSRRIFLAQPQSLFRGEGLWLWGCDETTLIHNIKAGNQTCFNVSLVAIPGLFFEAGLAFAEFEQLVEPIAGGWTHERLKKLPPVKPHQHIRSPTVEIGNSLSLDVEGPLTHAVMWGLSVH